MKETRKKFGKMWKLGLYGGDAEKYYNEFKDEIDKEISIVNPIIKTSEEKDKKIKKES